MTAPRQHPEHQSFDTLPEVARPLIGAAGRRFTLEFPASFGNQGETYSRLVTVMGDPFPHGWRTRGGGWALKYSGFGYVRSWRLPVRRYRGRRVGALILDNLLAVTEGWE